MPEAGGQVGRDLRVRVGDDADHRCGRSARRRPLGGGEPVEDHRAADRPTPGAGRRWAAVPTGWATGGTTTARPPPPTWPRRRRCRAGPVPTTCRRPTPRPGRRGRRRGTWPGTGPGSRPRPCRPGTAFHTGKQWPTTAAVPATWAPVPPASRRPTAQASDALEGVGGQDPEPPALAQDGHGVDRPRVAAALGAQVGGAAGGQPGGHVGRRDGADQVPGHGRGDGREAEARPEA